MPKKLFDEDNNEDDFSFKESEYSRKYNVLRRKEELLKLKNKYGERPDRDSESSTSEDEDEDVVFSDKFERDFFKTLSCLKNKDPRIYDKDVRFFNEESASDVVRTEGKAKKEKAVTVRDYNREIILNKQTGNVSSDEEENDRPASPTYVQEQNELKKMFSNAVKEDDENSDQELGGLFSKKTKSEKELEEEEKNYREWLAGEASHLKDHTDEADLKPLKDYWADPKLDEGEAFLRDYVLNQSFRDPLVTKKKIPSYEEIVNDDDISEDEKLVSRQAEFEHKFNFRYEEPDQEFIKQYPRTLEHTLRSKDNKRAKKRAEVKQRKAEEKQQKKEEISQLKALKLKEIEEKITKLKEITGNDQLGFSLEDIDGDFDPDAHDKRMQEVFNEDYYGDEIDEKKPEFPEIDDELEIENWEKWDQTDDNYELHCEDEDFNMDCDYDPKASASKSSLLEDIKDSIEVKKKRRRKKGKLAELLVKEKPKFDPEKVDRSLSEYIDEYYKLDCEDVIGDMPCRFKYREVPACNYGLTLEEILLADDAELNKWYPLKKTLQHRPDHLQINDQKLYEKRAHDINLKRKILPSLFKTHESDDNLETTENDVGTKKKKKKKKNKKKHENPDEIHVENGTVSETESKSKKRKRNVDSSVEESDNIQDKDETSDVKKSKKKKRNSEGNVFIESLSDPSDAVNTVQQSVPQKQKKIKMKKLKYEEVQLDESENKKNRKEHVKRDDIGKKKKRKNKTVAAKDAFSSNLTDERLKAYGLNPKKYRSFMKFKKF